MTLRVLHVIPSVAPQDGGPSSAVIGICRALIAEGREVEIATTDADGAGRLRVALHRRVEYEGVPTTFFPRRASVAFKWSPALAAWARDGVRAYSVVHVHGVLSHAPLAAGRACRAASVPYLVRPLGTLDPWSLGQKAWRKRLLLRLGGRALLDGAAALHYTSAEECRRTESGLGPLPRGVVIPIGVGDEYFAVQPVAHEPPRLLSLGRLDAKKGLDRLIAAFHRLAGRPDVPRWRLTIAGEGAPSYVAALQALARRGAAADRIDFAGWVSGAAKHALLASADLFVLPSYQENFGIAVVEAMAAGLPVVVAPGVNLSSDIHAAGAGWVAGLEETRLIAVLAEAMRDADARRRRGAAARRYAEAFRWRGIARQLTAIYDALAANDRSAVRGRSAEGLAPGSLASS